MKGFQKKGCTLIVCQVSCQNYLSTLKLGRCLIIVSCASFIHRLFHANVKQSTCLIVKQANSFCNTTYTHVYIQAAREINFLKIMPKRFRYFKLCVCWKLGCFHRTFMTTLMMMSIYTFTVCLGIIFSRCCSCAFFIKMQSASEKRCRQAFDIIKRKASREDS